jgi:hypothetical protein
VIYYLENLNSEILKDYYFLGDFLISNTYGFKILFISLILLILLFQNLDKKILSKLLYLFGFITYLAVFIITQKLTDESFLNFEMAYNYHHFGIFSFSPIEKISASIDLLFNIIMSVFANSRESLILSYHFLNFFLGLFTIIFIYKIINPKSFFLKIITISFASFYAPLIEIYSNFFPNSIVGFLFVLTVYFLVQSSKYSFIFYTSIVLFRVEGIIISAFGFVTDFFINKKRNLISLFLLPFFYFIYFTLHKYFFGYYYPTPLKFKSFGLDQITMLSMGDYLSMIINFFNYFHLFSIIIIIFSFLIFYRKAKNFQIKKKFSDRKFLILSTLFILSCFIFFVLEPTIFGVNFDNRYFVFMEIMFVIYPIYILDLVYKELYFDNKFLFFPGSIILFTILLSILIPSNSNKENIYKNKQKYIYNAYSKYEHLGAISINTSESRGVAGYILGRILPSEWKVGIHELNAFGFYNDLHLYDLWGYTNSEIASANQFASYRRQRNNPEYFLKENIDLIWAWSFNVAFWDDEVYKINSINDLKPYQGSNFTKNHNLVGDINSFFKNYDTIVLKVDNYIIYLHSLKSKTKNMIKVLEKNKFNLKFKKEINLNKIFEDNKKDKSIFYIF